MIPDKRPDQKAQRETDLLAFVQGEVNVAAMQEAVRHMDSLSSDIFEGSIKDMAKYLSQRNSPKVLLVDVSHLDLPLSELSDLAKPSATAEYGLLVIRSLSNIKRGFNAYCDSLTESEPVQSMV